MFLTQMPAKRRFEGSPYSQAAREVALIVGAAVLVRQGVGVPAEPVPREPGLVDALLERCGEDLSAGRACRGEDGRRIALAGQLVEAGLASRGVEAVDRPPGRSGALHPDGRIAGVARIPRHIERHRSEPVGVSSSTRHWCMAASTP